METKTYPTLYYTYGHIRQTDDSFIFRHVDNSNCRPWLTRDVALSMQKGTKNALETGRTFATLFADMDLRLRLLVARTEGEFKRLMWEHMKEKSHGKTEMAKNSEGKERRG